MSQAPRSTKIEYGAHGAPEASRTARIALLVTVTINPRRADRNREDEWKRAFLSRLTRRANELAYDLGLAAEPVIELVWGDEAALGESAPFGLLVGGELCRVARNVEPPHEWDPAELAERVAEALYWNRATALTSAVIE